MSDVTNTVDTSENYDAQQTVEEIAVGDRQAPAVNVEADYEASKQFSVSPIDRTEDGAAAAEAVSTPQLDAPVADVATSTPNTTGNPEDYKQMAENMSSAMPDSGNVSDDLVKKALDKGTAGA
jgi:hypothetical protein